MSTQHAFNKTRPFGETNKSAMHEHYDGKSQSSHAPKNRYLVSQMPQHKNDQYKNIRKTQVSTTRTQNKHICTTAKLERRVLLLVGWPLSSFLQLERFLISSLGMHRNAHSDKLSCCPSLIFRNSTNKFAFETRQSVEHNQRIILGCTRWRAHTIGIRTSAPNVC